MSRQAKRRAKQRRWEEIQRLAAEQKADDTNKVSQRKTPAENRQSRRRHNDAVIQVQPARIFPTKQNAKRSLPPEALAEIERLYQERLARRKPPE